MRRRTPAGGMDLVVLHFSRNIGPSTVSLTDLDEAYRAEVIASAYLRSQRPVCSQAHIEKGPDRWNHAARSQLGRGFTVVSRSPLADNDLTAAAPNVAWATERGDGWWHASSAPLTLHVLRQLRDCVSLLA